MKINGVVQRKLALLDHRVLRLQQELVNVPRQKFVDDWCLRSMTERELQVSIEIVIDIAERIIAIMNAGPTATAGDAIRRLVDLHVIKSDDPYVDMVRFRNMIVHQYEEIDPDILYVLATKKLADFRRFRDEVDLFVASENGIAS